MSAERTPHADDSLLAAPLLAVTEWGLSAPATVLVSACALAVLAVAVTVNGLTFKTSRLDLLNPRSEYNQRWLNYLAEFGDRDDACLVVRAERHAEDEREKRRDKGATVAMRSAVIATGRPM